MTAKGRSPKSMGKRPSITVCSERKMCKVFLPYRLSIPRTILLLSGDGVRLDNELHSALLLLGGPGEGAVAVGGIHTGREPLGQVLKVEGQNLHKDLYK